MTGTGRSNTHDSAPCVVLFNPLYDVVVTASVGSTVSIWNVRTGEKKLTFDRAHVSTVFNIETVSAEMRYA